MPHLWFAGYVAIELLLHIVIRSCLACVLTEMFCPRMHQKYLHEPVRCLCVTIDSPAIRTVATPNAGVLADRFQEYSFVSRSNGVFDRDQDRTLEKFSFNFFHNNRHASVNPRSEIGG